MDYTVQFMDTFAHLQLSQYHDRLHEIFESLLNTVTQDIPMQDQVRFALQSPQLETPISLPFLPRQRLTTERVLAEIERVIWSNHEFRLNDSVNVNLIHVEMPNGGANFFFGKQSDSSLIVGRIIDPPPGLHALSMDPFVPCVTHWYTIYPSLHVVLLRPRVER